MEMNKKKMVIAAVWMLVTGVNGQNAVLDGQFRTVTTGLIASIHAFVVPRTGKVVMLERIDGGQQGTTHAAEMDQQTYEQRALVFGSDVFCSAGFVSPDAEARVINVGGWMGAALEAVRVYTPCGAPGGVFGNCGWYEDAQGQVGRTLQVPRWYASALPMPSGRVAVIGGTTGPTGLFPPAMNQPSVEMLPRAGMGEVPVTLPLLVETDTFNLYPHAHVLPDGAVVLVAGDRAQVVEGATFGVRAELAVVPGGGKRTYPFTGGSVLLPLSWRDGYRAELLVCGGGTDTQVDAPALDSCARICPLEAAQEVLVNANLNPNANLMVQKNVWTLEAMPVPRLMPDMTLLADGRVLITSGSTAGWAGFANALSPTTLALIYDASAPPGARMRSLASSPIARLYHSEALLLDDARVLVIGSTPNADANVATTNFPNEQRIEIFTPPYLTSGLQRPVILINQNPNPIGNLNANPNANPNANAINNGAPTPYGTAFALRVLLPSTIANSARVAIHTNGFVTHSTHMGQRHVELAAAWTQVPGNASLFTATITAPPSPNVAPPGWYQVFVLDGPTPSIARWIQIGGDPAGITNWMRPLN